MLCGVGKVIGYCWLQIVFKFVTLKETKKKIVTKKSYTKNVVTVFGSPSLLLAALVIDPGWRLTVNDMWYNTKEKTMKIYLCSVLFLRDYIFTDIL